MIVKSHHDIAGKGVTLRHLTMANRCGFDTGVKTVFMNSVIKSTSKLIQSDQWSSLVTGWSERPTTEHWK